MWERELVETCHTLLTHLPTNLLSYLSEALSLLAPSDRGSAWHRAPLGGGGAVLLLAAANQVR